VLDENSELLKNTFEAKQKLELEVKNLYLVTITSQKIEKDEKLKASYVAVPDNSETMRIRRSGFLVFNVYIFKLISRSYLSFHKENLSDFNNLYQKCFIIKRLIKEKRL